METTGLSQLPGIGQLISDSWRVYKSSLLRLVLVSLVFIGIFIVAALVLGGSGVALVTASNNQLSWPVAFPIMLGFIAIIVVGSWMTVSLIKVILAEGKVGVKETLKTSWALVGKYILLQLALMGVMLLSVLPMIIPGIFYGISAVVSNSNPVVQIPLIVLSVITGIGAILFMILVSIWVMFSQYILVNEGTGAIDSIKRSKHYVKAHFWGVLGRVFLVGIIIFVIGLIVGGIMGLLRVLGNGNSTPADVINVIYQIVSLAVISPLSFIYNTRVYLAAKNAAPLQGTPQAIA